MTTAASTSSISPIFTSLTSPESQSSPIISVSTAGPTSDSVSSSTSSSSASLHSHGPSDDGEYDELMELAKNQFGHNNRSLFGAFLLRPPLPIQAYVTPARLPVPSPQEIVERSYPLEGGVTIVDRTNGVASAFFERHGDQICYFPKINGRVLVRPTVSQPENGPNYCLVNSLRITMEYVGLLIKITEEDARTHELTTVYVDPQKPSSKTTYDAYDHMPQEINEQNARSKLADLTTRFPNLQYPMAIYNRHGVAVFGYESHKNDPVSRNVLYWASPQDNLVRLMNCSECSRMRDGGTSIAKSTDGRLPDGRYLEGNVNFRGYPQYNKYALNGEPATRIQI